MLNTIRPGGVGGTTPGGEIIILFLVSVGRDDRGGTCNVIAYTVDAVGAVAVEFSESGEGTDEVIDIAVVAQSPVEFRVGVGV